ncbi:MAG: hypothetical protein UX60_C0007G0004 [Berkelbacteria bacterium GW2011_GWA2_46_7]|uniref:Uncharacterized protein n=1 Tax=Berkelbacteria bacterium GW2011_GWA2_46_7 TaxID=1618335 RepID=A0A0G1TG13_9BACT|nr:MAG: hypothetical protein UX60_C0007G0004 [Berkelbacteria bacterium GW2011_GWA2_46_7]
MGFQIAIKEAGKIESEITIDREYPGYDALIKEKVVVYLEKLRARIDPDLLSIGLVGKESGSHMLAYKSAKSNSCQIKLTAGDILSLVKMKPARTRPSEPSFSSSQKIKNRRVLKKRLSRLVGTPSGFYDKSISKSERKVKREK